MQLWHNVTIISSRWRLASKGAPCALFSNHTYGRKHRPFVRDETVSAREPLARHGVQLSRRCDHCVLLQYQLQPGMDDRERRLASAALSVGTICGRRARLHNWPRRRRRLLLAGAGGISAAWRPPCAVLQWHRVHLDGAGRRQRWFSLQHAWLGHGHAPPGERGRRARLEPQRQSGKRLVLGQRHPVLALIFLRVCAWQWQ